jgi:hypothetical protein
MTDTAPDQPTTEVPTIDVTPKWEWVARMMIEVLRNKKARQSALDAATIDIIQMGRLADAYVGIASVRALESDVLDEIDWPALKGQFATMIATKYADQFDVVRFVINDLLVWAKDTGRL